tara:strand:- start:944 stop:2245 length:1302 start_codon:yes stop_codon:yes gene_type:complete
MKSRFVRLLFPLGFVCLVNCSENIATAPDLDLIDIEPYTLEVMVPFADFVQELNVVGGYGSSSDLGSGVVAKDFNGFSAKTIVRFSSYPESVELGGSTSGLKFIGGRVVLAFDSVQGPNNEAIGLQLSATQQAWDSKTVTWKVAVDTVGNKTSWVQPGAGTSVLVGSGDLDSHLAGDSVNTFASISIDVDSATVAAWGGERSYSRGMVVASTDSATRLNLWDAQLVLKAIPLINPDTIVEIPVPVSALSFMVDPMPTNPGGWLRVGGLPAWRSVMTMKLPDQVKGSVEICGNTGCLFDVSKSQLNLAELILTTRETEAGFKPTTPLAIQIRSVLSPSSLPKSPLGDPVGLQQGVLVQPKFFDNAEGEQVVFSLTDLLGFSDRELSGTFPSNTVALLSSNEGTTLDFASFQGSGDSGFPVLRLILTVPKQGSSP